MKPHLIEPIFGKRWTQWKTQKLVLLIALSVIFLAITTIHVQHPSFWSSSYLQLHNATTWPYSLPTTSYRHMQTPANSTAAPAGVRPGRQGNDERHCDLFSGEWVPNPEAPYYTNRTCTVIQEFQNCMKYGRPDNGFLKWRWKPDGDGCELPTFNPTRFLELVKGKSMAFVGDSLARNHMQSLICLLSRVEDPVEVQYIRYDLLSKRYEFKKNNFTVAILWSPHLVRTTKTDRNDTATSISLFLDEADEKWTSRIHDFNYVIISAGNWFFQPYMLYVGGHLLGCIHCPQQNPNVTMYFSYQMAFKTAFKALDSLERYKGMTILRTFSPYHYENGEWNKGGDCVRKRPFGRGESGLEGLNLELHRIQVEEFKVAEREGGRRGLSFGLIDVTEAMSMRPDGHPSKYGHWPNVSRPNDCVHWCLPGPIDTWNDFLLQLLGGA